MIDCVIERIKQANAPEIERINAYIKYLENTLESERKACKNMKVALEVIASGVSANGSMLSGGECQSIAYEVLNEKGVNDGNTTLAGRC